MKWSIVVVVVSVFSCSQAQGLNSWCPNHDTDLSTCVNQYLNQYQTIGKEFKDASGAWDVKAWVAKDASTICQPATLTAVENAYGCYFEKIWACIPSDWLKGYPGLDKKKAQLKFVCDNKDDLDFPCLTHSVTTMYICLMRGVTTPAKMTADAFLKYICSMTARYTPCSDTVYAECEKNTAEVMKKYYEYEIPVGCDAYMSKPSLILLIAFLIVAFVNKNIF